MNFLINNNSETKPPLEHSQINKLRNYKEEISDEDCAINSRNYYKLNKSSKKYNDKHFSEKVHEIERSKCLR